ncbi:hypothetical protein [Methylophilus sp. TWE2]|uniref:hypothetical protein n=1 Tax=Methylophilus sp. TWE2 TaxID=1662285 RepID=UPI0006709C7C|nr:hypothetical protein [Methylophilus sp. TWE2]AKR43619.1 hypothetical protein ACJ67_09410 [Methylophilus sp. TWE2]
MTAFEYIDTNKEWLLSGIGVTLLVAVGVAIKALWNKYRSKTQPPATSIPLPAFDLNGSTAKLTRTPIIGGVPHGLVKATGGGTFEMTDCLIQVSGPNVEYPAPTGELSTTSNSELTHSALELANQLEQFQAEISLEQDQAFSENKLADLRQIHEIQNQKFNMHLRNRSLQILCEMLHRLPPIERRTLPVEMRCGIDAALHGKLTGTRPAAGLASFFELLSKRLQ